MSALPDGELEMPGDDARLLIVPGGVPCELNDLGGEVLHQGGYVDGSSAAHPLGVVALPGQREVSNHPDQKNRRQVPEKPVESVKVLSAETVEGMSLPLEGVHHVHGSDGLPLGVLGVGDGVTDDVLEEDLKDAPRLLVDEAGDPLDAVPPGQAPDGGLSDPLKHKCTIMMSRKTALLYLDVVAKNLPMPLDSSLTQSLASLTTTRHPVKVGRSLKLCHCSFRKAT